MERLFSGEALQTDGTLNVKTLADEAGLSRQQVYRSSALNEFRDGVRTIQERGVTPGECQQREITRLSADLSAARRELSRCQVERDIAQQKLPVLMNELKAGDELTQHLETQLALGGIAVSALARRTDALAAKASALTDLCAESSGVSYDAPDVASGVAQTRD